jgi:hypothetical protein
MSRRRRVDEAKKQISFGAINEKNIEQIKKLNIAVFPVRYNDEFYKNLASTPIPVFNQLGARTTALRHFSPARRPSRAPVASHALRPACAAYFSDIPVGNICCRRETGEGPKYKLCAPPHTPELPPREPACIHAARPARSPAQVYHDDLRAPPVPAAAHRCALLSFRTHWLLPGASPRAPAPRSSRSAAAASSGSSSQQQQPAGSQQHGRRLPPSRGHCCGCLASPPCENGL